MRTPVTLIPPTSEFLRHVYVDPRTKNLRLYRTGREVGRHVHVKGQRFPSSKVRRFILHGVWPYGRNRKSAAELETLLEARRTGVALPLDDRHLIRPDYRVEGLKTAYVRDRFLGVFEDPDAAAYFAQTGRKT